MPAETEREKFLDALDESFQAMMDAIRKGSERRYRFSRRLLNDVEEGQREMAQLARRFARNPRDMRGVYEESVDLARRNVRHSTELAREWFAEMGEEGRETRSTAQAVARANSAAAQALGAALRSAAVDLAQGARAIAPRPVTASKPAASRPMAASKPAAPRKKTARRRRTVRVEGTAPTE